MLFFLEWIADTAAYKGEMRKKGIFVIFGSEKGLVIALFLYSPG
jgi:hypothetical protein